MLLFTIFLRFHFPNRSGSGGMLYMDFNIIGFD